MSHNEEVRIIIRHSIYTIDLFVVTRRQTKQRRVSKLRVPT